MRRCCAAAMKGAGFRATHPLMAATTGRMANVLPAPAVKKPTRPPLPRPATKALRDMWKPTTDNCNIDTLCCVCRSFAANPRGTRTHEKTPIETDIYASFQGFVPPIVVASVIMGMLGQRVPVPKVRCAEVFECLALIDKLGDEDRVAVERGMYDLLYYSMDTSAAVLAYCVRPAGLRCMVAPPVSQFLESLVSSDDLRKPDTDTPPTNDDDTDESIALKDYLKAFSQDEVSVCAVVSLIRGVPDRYKNRCDILFAMHLETLLRACARDVWGGDTDTTTTTSIGEMLENMRSKPSDVVSGGPSQAATLQPDEITFEGLRDRDDWHPGFTKVFDNKETRFILESVRENKDGKKKYEIYPLTTCGGQVEYALRSDKRKDFITNFSHLAQMLRDTVPVPELKPFDASSVLLPRIELNAGIQGDLFPELLGSVPRDMDADPCLEQQLLKRHCTLVNGASGTGKTVFATLTLPRAMYKDALVLHQKISDKDPELADIERLDKEYHDDLQQNKWKEMRHLFASCALRRRRESTPYADAVQYARWMEECNTILGKNDRNERAKKYIVDVLKELLGKERKWVSETDGVERYPNTVILVVDELGKCLPLARAIISAQYSIYRDEWVRNHFAKLELVLCGTGTEMAVSPSSWFIATDPTSVNVITLLKPNPLLLDAVFFQSLLTQRTSGKDTVELAKRKAQSLYPILYSQYISSSLFNDAKTNTRLYIMSCYFLRTILTSLDKNVSNVPEELERKHAARMDSCFARTLGLDGCVRLAIQWFIRCNGLGCVREEHDRMSIDAALTSALQHVRPLIPLPPLHKDATRMERAATLGLIVRRGDEIPSPALTAVITFGYTEPCAALEGYTQEQFTAEWASRLVEVQTGYAAPIVSLPFCVPWKGRRPPSADDIASLVQKLREHKALVLLNGPSAPGADVMVVQLRRPYDEVATRMSREAYWKLYPDGVAAILTLISNKQRSRERLQQALTLGVVNTEELLESILGAGKKKTWHTACNGERKARENIVKLFGTLDEVFNPNTVAGVEKVKSLIQSYLQSSNAYRNLLHHLSIISTAYKNNDNDETAETKADESETTETNAAETDNTDSEMSKSESKRLQNQMSLLNGLQLDEYQYAGPLFLGLVCARALVPVATQEQEQLADLLTEDPDRLRSALDAALKDDAVVDEMRKMCEETDNSDVRVLVLPRFVCGSDPASNKSEDWRKTVLSGNAFSWACAEDDAEWVCPPGSFGPLEKMIRVESKSKTSKKST